MAAVREMVQRRPQGLVVSDRFTGIGRGHRVRISPNPAHRIISGSSPTLRDFAIRPDRLAPPCQRRNDWSVVLTVEILCGRSLPRVPELRLLSSTRPDGRLNGASELEADGMAAMSGDRKGALNCDWPDTGTFASSSSSGSNPLMPKHLARLKELGLNVTRTIQVWPAGLPGRGWDGEGSSEWLTTESPCFGIAPDHPLDALSFRLNDDPEQILPTDPQSGATFVRLPPLALSNEK